jgi:hypothetical protein
MDNISRENSSISKIGNIKPNLYQSPSLSKKDNRIINEEKSVSTSLTNLSELAKTAQSSNSDIRADAIKRAHDLLNDPNWLSDNNLDTLASKLTHLEKF